MERKAELRVATSDEQGRGRRHTSGRFHSKTLTLTGEGRGRDRRVRDVARHRRATETARGSAATVSPRPFRSAFQTGSFHEDRTGAGG